MRNWLFFYDKTRHSANTRTRGTALTNHHQQDMSQLGPAAWVTLLGESVGYHDPGRSALPVLVHSGVPWQYERMDIGYVIMTRRHRTISDLIFTQTRTPWDLTIMRKYSSGHCSEIRMHAECIASLNSNLWKTRHSYTRIQTFTTLLYLTYRATITLTT